VCCHLGAREHYAVPRALHQRGRLHRLITDAWVAPGDVWGHLPGNAGQRLSERFHPDLGDAGVRAFTLPLVSREARWKVAQLRGWDLLMARNRWFGHRSAKALQGIPDAITRTVVFAHSYSCREAFAYAKSRNWTTVMGQIDPGEEHFRVVRELAKAWPGYGSPPSEPPPAYFQAWRDECALADWIVVNSDWTREALIRAGVSAAKLRLIPLAYEPEHRHDGSPREYPEAFGSGRPMRALFVGSVAVAKGLPPLLEAVDQLGLPIHLSIVGATAMIVPPRFQHHPAIRWVGAVSRSDVMRYYRESDVLVFPSYSDGFGMAQIEAQGWSLPIIASRHCGRVVEDGVTGLLLPEVSVTAIAAALRRLVESPALLRGFASQSSGHRPPGLAELSTALVELESAQP
jgi:glycosyltransferase involved in cell wall biosynthesis